MVRAHGLARSPRAVPAQWRPVPVDHLEQEQLGALLLTTTGRRWGQERSVIVGYIEDGPDLVAARDERLGRGPSRLVAQPRGAPRGRRSIGAPATAPGRQSRARPARSVTGCGNAGRRWKLEAGRVCGSAVDRNARGRLRARHRDGLTPGAGVSRTRWRLRLRGAEPGSAMTRRPKEHQPCHSSASNRSPSRSTALPPAKVRARHTVRACRRKAARVDVRHPLVARADRPARR